MTITENWTDFDKTEVTPKIYNWYSYAIKEIKEMMKQ